MPCLYIHLIVHRPNSSIQCYVTASCTDGNTYVWDTAQGDRPIHTLGHGGKRGLLAKFLRNILMWTRISR
jgi:hypothetical protein